MGTDDYWIGQRQQDAQFMELFDIARRMYLMRQPDDDYVEYGAYTMRWHPEDDQAELYRWEDNRPVLKGTYEGKDLRP